MNKIFHHRNLLMTYDNFSASAISAVMRTIFTTHQRGLRKSLMLKAQTFLQLTAAEAKDGALTCLVVASAACIQAQYTQLHASCWQY